MTDYASYIAVGFPIADADMFTTTVAKSKSCPNGHETDAETYCGRCGIKLVKTRTQSPTEAMAVLYSKKGWDLPERLSQWRADFEPYYYTPELQVRKVDNQEYLMVIAQVMIFALGGVRGNVVSANLGFLDEATKEINEVLQVMALNREPRLICHGEAIGV